MAAHAAVLDSIGHTALSSSECRHVSRDPLALPPAGCTHGWAAQVLTYLQQHDIDALTCESGPCSCRAYASAGSQFSHSSHMRGLALPAGARQRTSFLDNSSAFTTLMFAANCKHQHLRNVL